MKWFLKKFKRSDWSSPGGRVKLADVRIFTAVFLILISLSYCFRKDVFVKVESYNSIDDVLSVVPYYIGILSVSPGVNAAGVSVNTDITVEFNDNIDMSTVTSSDFSVNGGITGTFSYDDQLKTVTFTPGTAFTELSSYTVNLTTGIKNVSGESMASDYSWSFTTGSALHPEIYVMSPLSELFTGEIYDFGSEAVSTGRSASFCIGNSGNAALTVANAGDISVSGTDASMFVITVNPAPVMITSGSTGTVTVTFTPGSAGIKNAVMTVVSNDADESSFIINLTGNGLVSPEPEIQVTKSGTILVSPTSAIDFGTVIAGGSKSIELVMYNIGNYDLTVSSFSFGGTYPGLYSTDFGTVPVVIAAGTTKTFNITFSPAGKVNASANITFQNNDLDESSFTIKLKGRCK